MVTFGQVRLCLSFFPLILSVPFAWRVHENKKLDAAVDLENTIISDNGVEDLDKVEDEGFNELTKEVVALNDLLGLNFGKENKLMFVDLAESSDQSVKWPSDVKEWLAFIKQLTIHACLKVAKLAQSEFSVMSLVLNLAIFVVFVYLKPVFNACSSHVTRLLVAQLAKLAQIIKYIAGWIPHRVKCMFTKPNAKKAGNEPTKTPDVAAQRSLNNIKDPESILALACPGETNRLETIDTVQGAVFDEKENWSGFEERQDNDSHEWLEGSFIEGGIETFSPLEADGNKVGNKTEDYLQMSSNNREPCADASDKAGPRTSTPASSSVFGESSQQNGSYLNETRTYTPKKLKKFMFDKFNESGLGVASCLSELENSHCIIVDEQKKESNMRQIDWGRGIDDLVNVTKNRIRNRLMNVSYV
ncbi:uncharacterized protein LOC135683156 [Rhopilema esculentum]|uniref:uncharacterized protein LOC135683156 n=1 Tax=Rhopilema esculentum TaxID=499914 RepID=UPI0031DB8AC3|eukprot:gene16019-7362_t